MKTILAFLLVAAATAPAQQVKLPPFTRLTLPNGATLLLMPRQDAPLVTLRAAFKGGAEASDPAKAGLAPLVAELLRRGTATRSGEKFSEEVDALGAAFNTYASRQSLVIESEFLARSTAPALALFADAILHPTFPEDELKKALAQRIDRAKAAKDNPGAAINGFHEAFFYGPTHDYGLPLNGDETTLPKITRADVLEFHKRNFSGANLILIAAGAFDPKTLAPELEKLFAALPKGQPHTWKMDNAPARPAQNRLLLVDKPDATQTYFQISQPGITRKTPDWPTLWLLNTLFGGRFTSMLNDELRVNSGLTYGANSLLTRDRRTGRISITTYTRTDTTEKAIDLALDILKRLNEKGITADQLASAKAYLKGTFPPRSLETADQLAEVLEDLELYNLNRGEIDDLFSRLDAVTLDQANAAAKKYYQTQGLVFTLLGNAANIRDVARKYAPQIIEVPITTPGYQVPSQPVK
ncbi:MAG: pitrilysin family protein [Bryobacteraceae bacterium]|nr:pitrilysin family protein [Bryobacteraceae bacterium]